jgi:hypothetical protein
VKISIDIDCTPEEARTFLGLPDVKPMQDAVMHEIQAQMIHNIKAMDTETMLRTWVPAQVQGLEQMQKFFWSQFAKGGRGGGEP